MISGTFIYTDTIDRAFNQIFSDANEGAAVVVTGKQEFGSEYSSPPSVPQSLVSKIASLSDVSKAAGQVSDTAAVIGKDGKVVTTGGAPTLAFSYTAPPFDSLSISSGKAPANGDVVIDSETVKGQGFKVGSPVKISTREGVQSFTLVGTAEFGESSLGGATLVVFSLSDAQRIFDKKNEVDSISVAAKDGASESEVLAQVRSVIPADAQAKSGKQQASDDAAQITDNLSFLKVSLLAFGFIAVFVGAFIIFNTYSITVTQRTKEFALLRTLGAKRRQVLTAVAGEALMVGLLASGLGILLGLLTAKGINALFVSMGIDLPTTSPVVAARTVWVSLSVGVVVTLFAAVGPAIRATKVSPLASLRSAVQPKKKRRLVSTVVALLLLVAGGLLVAAGLLGDSGSVSSRLSGTAGGAILMVIAIALLSPPMVPVVARVLGWPLEKITVVVGRLARGNAQRNPGRTAVTAASLMIGLSIVIFVTIFANGLKVSIDQAIDESFKNDFTVINNSQDGFSTIPDTVATDLQKVAGIEIASPVKFDAGKLNGKGLDVTAIDPTTYGDVFEFDWKNGSNSDLVKLSNQSMPGLILDEDTATELKVSVGETLTLKAPTGKSSKVQLVAVTESGGSNSGPVISIELFDKLFNQPRIFMVLVKDDPGASLKAVGARINTVLKSYPEAVSRSRDEIKEQFQKQVNQLLYMIYALLALSVIVALFGLANTLQLSIYERTREIGMLRAIGMSRSQVRRVVRYESVITAAFGAVLGLLLGVFFAWVVTRSLESEGIVFALPWGQMGVFMLVALFAGVAAAVPPARKASKMDVLEAISYE